MGNTYLNDAELHLQQERRSALEAVDCSIEQKNRHISGIRDYKHIEYGMNAFGFYQVLAVKGHKTVPHELTGHFTHPNYLIKEVDNLIREGKLIEPK